MSISIPDLVWNRGIAALCDWRIPDEFPNGASYVPIDFPSGDIIPGTPYDLIANPDVYCGVREGDIVWVRVAWLNSFVRQVLPIIRVPFVLATGDSDSSVPSNVQPYGDLILKHKNVLQWFAQNCDSPEQDSRFSRLPIGIDFHSLHRRTYWGEPPRTPLMQERELQAIAKSLPPLEQRISKAYLDFAWQPHDYGGRHELLRALSTNECVYCQERFLPRSEMWKRRGEYVFVVSPLGIGLDCHRTWEALALGHIVIAPVSPLRPLFDGLAVVSIDDPRLITRANLHRWLEALAPRARQTERLTNQWWVSEMRRFVTAPRQQSGSSFLSV